MVDLDGLVDVAKADAHEVRLGVRLEQMTADELREALTDALHDIARLRSFIPDYRW